jgi:hypothetical protein
MIHSAHGDSLPGSWQTLKVRYAFDFCRSSLSLGGPTSNPSRSHINKTRTLASVRFSIHTNNGRFVKNVRGVGFRSLPANCSGYWSKNSRSALSARIQSLPSFLSEFMVLNYRLKARYRLSSLGVKSTTLFRHELNARHAHVHPAIKSSIFAYSLY